MDNDANINDAKPEDYSGMEGFPEEIIKPIVKSRKSSNLNVHEKNRLFQKKLEEKNKLEKRRMKRKMSKLSKKRNRKKK